MMRPGNAMIILAGGRGNRMESDVPKQFMSLGGKPVLWYSLNAVQRSELIDEAVVVSSPEFFSDIRAMADRYGFDKVSHLVSGGEERFLSVVNGVRALYEAGEGCETFAGAPEIILVHDAARPFIDDEIIRRCLEGVSASAGCVAAVPSKDTVKLADEEGFVTDEPDRKNVWCMQTPQVFYAGVLKSACEKAYADIEKSRQDLNAMPSITDDAQMVRMYENIPIRLVMGSYDNIKITTPVDLLIAEKILENRSV